MAYNKTNKTNKIPKIHKMRPIAVRYYPTNYLHNSSLRLGKINHIRSLTMLSDLHEYVQNCSLKVHYTHGEYE